MKIVEKISVNGMTYSRKTVYDGLYMSIEDESLPYDVIVSVQNNMYYFVDRKKKLYDRMAEDEYNKKFGNRDVLYNISHKHFVIQERENDEARRGKEGEVLHIIVPELRVEIDVWHKKLEYSLHDYYASCSKFKILGFYGNLARYIKADNCYPKKMRVATKSSEILKIELVSISRAPDTVDVEFMKKYKQSSFF